MKILVLFMSLSVLSQPAFCGQLVSTWQRLSRSLLTPAVTLAGTTVAAGATNALIGGEATLGVVALGLGYFLYSHSVSESRMLYSDDIGRRILYQDGDQIEEAIIAEVSEDNLDFKTTDGQILASEDVIAYEVDSDHDDLGRQVLLSANNGYIEGHIGKVFTDGFYEIVIPKVDASDPVTLFANKKDIRQPFRFL